MGKPFKETGVGKVLWKIGDTLKGKTKVGGILDSALEVLPVPNPIRIGKAIDKNAKIEKLKLDGRVQQAASDNGINLDDLLDDSPDWVKTAFAFASLLILGFLTWQGVIDWKILLKYIATVIGVGGAVLTCVPAKYFNRYLT